jgi:PAS domain S-box-containing protein
MCAIQGRDVQELLKRMSGLEGLRHSVVVTDTTGTITYWNPAAERLLGWSRDEAVGLRLDDLVTLEAPPDELIQRVLVDPEWSGEMALRRRAGTAFLARVHQVGVVDELGHLSGTLRIIADITDHTWSSRARQERGERAVSALHAAGVGSWTVDVTTGLATWDETMESLAGLPPGTFPGSRSGWLELIHDEDREWVEQEIAKATTSGSAHIDIEYRVAHADDATIWLKCLGRTITDAGGAAVSITGVAFDITERRRADEERSAFLAAERARRDRFTLLAEASATFAASLDDEDVIAAIGKLVVPRLADWLAIDMVSGSEVSTVATVHSDSARRELLGYLGRRFGSSGGIIPDVAGVLREGRARLHEHADLNQWPAVVENPEHRAMLSSVGIHSAMIVPLTARGRTFGAMTCVIGDSHLSYSRGDVDLAEDLARRAALSIDNARLFADRAHVARVLQRSLLPPEMPAVEGAEVAARYRASEAGSEIGGDFYDVFQTADDRWNLVLGDVSGKGTDAAVLTGLARHTLRAAAMRASGPVEVLSALNHAIMAQNDGERFVTLAFVQMGFTGGGAELIVSSAGHPNPLIVRRDGEVEAVEACGGIIGLFEDVPIEHERWQLRGGDALVLYTDGVLEARDAQGQFYGDDRLRDLLAACGDRPAAEIAERIETAVMAFQDGSPRDDIAILVVRIDPTTAALHPQESSP